MAQLKTDEWPDEGEPTTTETQVKDLSPEQSIVNEGTESGNGNASDEDDDRRNVRPDEAGE